MLVLHRTTERWEDRSFRDLPEFLQSGDCLVLNDSKSFSLPPLRPSRRRPFASRWQAESQTARESEWRRRSVAAAADFRGRARSGRRWCGQEEKCAPASAIQLRRRAGGRDHLARRIRRAYAAIPDEWRCLRDSRKHRPRAAAALHQARGHARGSRALPDRVRARERLSGRADSRSALHAGGAGPVPIRRSGHRLRHAARRAWERFSRFTASRSSRRTCTVSHIASRRRMPRAWTRRDVW